MTIEKTHSCPSLTELYARSIVKPVAIAHRGACGLYPENTVLAMEKALAYGRTFSTCVKSTSTGVGRPKIWTERRSLPF